MTQDEMIEKKPQTAEEFVDQGWSFHAQQKDETAAEESFRRAISLSPESVDGYYGLGLILKAQGRKQESKDTFNKVIELLETNPTKEQARGEMMRRLSLAHINQMESGDWGLEGEIWKHST
jgi:tetratricopeptide (TPR) repeat protein